MADAEDLFKKALQLHASGDKTEATRHFVLASDAGHAQAAFVLAKLAINDIRYDEARRWGLMAAALGDAEATNMFNVADGADAAAVKESEFKRAVAFYEEDKLED